MAEPPDPLADLRRANAELTAARRAALNVMEDAIQTRDALRASEERLRAVAANLPNGAVFVLDHDLRYVLAGGEALGPAGVTPLGMEGRTLAEALPPDLVAESAANYRRALAGESLQTEHAAHGRHYVTHLAPLRDAAGNVEAALAVSYDITDRKRAETELQAARDELEARVAERTAELAGAYAALEEQFSQRQELARRLSTAVEDQRRRVSRELHDEMGQHLAALVLGLKAVERLTGPTDDLRRLQDLADRIGSEIHRIAVELRPTALDDLGLHAALRNYADEWSRQTGIGVELHCPGREDGRLLPEHETTVYRIVQEALTNVRRHAAATRVGVVVERRAGQLLAIVEDDGRGFDPTAADPRRLGLAGMRERAELLGGSVEVESGSGTGTTVFARLPLPAEGAADDVGRGDP